MQSHILQPSPEPELSLKGSPDVKAAMLLYPFPTSIQPSSGQSTSRVIHTCTMCYVRVCSAQASTELSRHPQSHSPQPALPASVQP